MSPGGEFGACAFFSSSMVEDGVCGIHRGTFGFALCFASRIWDLLLPEDVCQRGISFLFSPLSTARDSLLPPKRCSLRSRIFQRACQILLEFELPCLAHQTRISRKVRTLRRRYRTANGIRSGLPEGCDHVQSPGSGLECYNMNTNAQLRPAPRHRGGSASLSVSTLLSLRLGPSLADASVSPVCSRSMLGLSRVGWELRFFLRPAVEGVLRRLSATMTDSPEESGVVKGFGDTPAAMELRALDMPNRPCARASA